MTYLLDTHAFFWLVRAPDRVRLETREAIARASVVRVSAVSAFEVATKVRLGKFEPAREVLAAWSDTVRRVGATSLPVTTEDALRAGGLAWDHRDPFDRLIAAQAIVADLTLVTADRAFTGLPGLELMAC